MFINSNNNAAEVKTNRLTLDQPCDRRVVVFLLLEVDPNEAKKIGMVDPFDPGVLLDPLLSIVHTLVTAHERMGLRQLEDFAKRLKVNESYDIVGVHHSPRVGAIVKDSEAWKVASVKHRATLCVCFRSL